MGMLLVMTQHYAMLQRNLLYTGVTRGTRLVVLVGQKKGVGGFDPAIRSLKREAAMAPKGLMNCREKAERTPQFHPPLMAQTKSNVGAGDYPGHRFVLGQSLACRPSLLRLTDHFQLHMPIYGSI
jgi:UvrD-like helicase C-terminal domain